MSYITLIGILGSTFILLAFGMNQVNKWKNDCLIYDLVNFLGGILLITYAILISSIPFLILNLVWAGLSARDIFVDWTRNQKRERKGFFNKWLK